MIDRVHRHARALRTARPCSACTALLCPLDTFHVIDIAELTNRSRKQVYECAGFHRRRFLLNVTAFAVVQPVAC